jgi:hypothetical protein
LFLDTQNMAEGGERKLEKREERGGEEGHGIDET